MSIHTRAYHVLVPSTLTYWVEADSEEEAAQLVWAAVDPQRKWIKPDPSVALLADRVESKPPPYDVEFASACAGCGSEIDTDIHPTMCADCA